MAGDKGIGERVARVEDVRFLRGRSSFTDDLVAEGEVHAVFVRSPHAHARIVAIDADDARAAPGVLLVVTAGDIAEEIPNAIPSRPSTSPAGRTARPRRRTSIPLPATSRAIWASPSPASSPTAWRRRPTRRSWSRLTMSYSPR